MTIGSFLAVLLAVVVGEVDFSSEAGRIRPELHSSGLGPRLTGRGKAREDDFGGLGLHAARTHDWALANPGQRVCDLHFLFPLADRDPADPSNYFFGPTDELLRRTREAGLEVFFRLGSSIEHTGDVHWNTRVPDDFDRTAEVFAGIVRHYNRGWANGHRWNIRHWEIWNEPDGIDASWCKPGMSIANDGQRAEMVRLFARFYATCVKRLKAEFPEIRVGGPAFTGWWEPFFKVLLDECRARDAKPDFISWHAYPNSVSNLLDRVDRVRAFCDANGFPEMENVLDEWRYFPGDEGWADLGGTPEARRRVLDGDGGISGVDSAVFTLSALAGFQSSRLDQAFFYGCDVGPWGVTDAYGAPTKVRHALAAFGGFVRDCRTFVKAKADGPSCALFAAPVEAGGWRALVCDFRGPETALQVRVRGLPDGVFAQARVLDAHGDFEPREAVFRDGVLTLRKRGAGSAAFLVEFARGRSASPREKVVFDTDIGGDVDDALALTYLLNEPRCDLVGVTIESWGASGPRQAEIASAFCRSFGRGDVPVKVGSGWGNLTGLRLGCDGRPVRPPRYWPAITNLPHAVFAESNDAVDFLRRTIRENPGEITLLATGHFTNLGALFACDPKLPALLKRLVVMGGDMNGGGEWNQAYDPCATAAVFANGNSLRPPETVVYPSNVTKIRRMKPADARALFARAPKLDLSAKAAEYWFADGMDLFFHDPIAAVGVFEPEICAYTNVTVSVGIADRGRMTPDPRPQPGKGLLKVATSLDGDAFERAFLRPLK